MQVSLTPKLHELVRRKVKSGLYGDESEVVREALRLMAAHEIEESAKIARLRRALVRGERSGIARDYDIEGVIAELDGKVRRTRRQ